MLEFVKNITDFWSSWLNDHNYLHSVSLTANRPEFHNNYSTVESNIWQSFEEEIPEHDKFMKELGIKNGSISLICLEPNKIITVHTDNFYKLRQKYNVPVENCVRYLIFLQDFTFGHIVEFKTTRITNWKKGDIWKFDSNEPHYAANASSLNFITCQVNTVK